MPTVAATEAKIREFFRLLSVSTRPKTVSQLLSVKLPACSALLPTSILNEVSRIVAKGIRMTITAKSETKIVSGTLQRRSSTSVGCMDLPDTVMYCRFARTTSERNRMITASSIRNTAMPMASLSPCWPRETYSTMRVVTVCTRPGLPMIDGMP